MVDLVFYLLPTAICYPLVAELKEAWEHGFQVLTDNNVLVCVKLALTCVSCDIPASRKVCGFLSHNAVTNA